MCRCPSRSDQADPRLTNRSMLRTILALCRLSSMLAAPQKEVRYRKEARPLTGSQDFNPEVPVLTIPIRALLLLAMALAAVAASSAREGDQCYSSCKARCVARYACEGRHPGPNCFTNFNKCRTSCWRMCRH